MVLLLLLLSPKTKNSPLRLQVRRLKHIHEKIFQILKWSANRKVKAFSVFTEKMTRGDRLKLWQERFKGGIKETCLNG